MIRKTRPLTKEGKRIKKAIIDMEITQAEFCRRYGILPQRLCDIMHLECQQKPLLKTRLLVYRIIREAEEKEVVLSDK